MSQLKGLQIHYKSKLSPVVVSWKQGSVLGVGGNESHTYKVYVYTLGKSEGGDILLFVQDNMEAPVEMEINNRFQFGCQNGSVFLVLHDKSRTPYQYRFVENANLTSQIAKYANNFSKNWKYGYDFSWAIGDYLRDF